MSSPKNASHARRKSSSAIEDTEPPIPSYPDVSSRFWEFLKKHKKFITIAVAGNVFTVFLVMLVPLFAKIVIDEAIPGKNIPLLIGLAAALLVLQTIRVAIGYAHQFLVYYIGLRTVFDIRRALFHHLQLLHLSFYEKKKTASLVNHLMSDAASIQNFIISAFSTLSNSLTAFILALVMMFFLNVPATLFCLATLPIYFLMLRYFRKQLLDTDHEVRARQSELAGYLGETFAGMRVVKSFAQEDHERRRFTQTIKSNFMTELELPLIGTRMGCYLSFITFSVYAAVMIFLGTSSIHGNISIGGYVAYTSYLWMLFGPIDGLANLLQSATSARTGFERILTLLDIKPHILEDDNPVILEPIKGHLSFQKVNFSYESRATINDFNLEVTPGEVIALVGHSGSGKSTMMSLLTRFYDVTGGRILIDGVDIRRLKTSTYRQQIGLVLQDNFLFSGSVAENIRYGRPHASDDEVIHAAKLANAWEFIQEMTEGLNSLVGQGGVALSGGQRQRIAIARCFLKNSRIMIFDEATSALDNHSEALIQTSLDTLMEGRTVFIIAHRLTTIRKADRIVVMEHGNIAEVGTHEELLERQGAYYHLYRPKIASAPSEAQTNIAL